MNNNDDDERKKNKDKVKITKQVKEFIYIIKLQYRS